MCEAHILPVILCLTQMSLPKCEEVCAPCQERRQLKHVGYDKIIERRLSLPGLLLGTHCRPKKHSLGRTRSGIRSTCRCFLWYSPPAYPSYMHAWTDWWVLKKTFVALFRKFSEFHQIKKSVHGQSLTSGLQRGFYRFICWFCSCAVAHDRPPMWSLRNLRSGQTHISKNNFCGWTNLTLW